MRNRIAYFVYCLSFILASEIPVVTANLRVESYLTLNNVVKVCAKSKKSYYFDVILEAIL